MCGRYLVITEDEIIEMKSILEELNLRFATSDNDISNLVSISNTEIFPSTVAPVLVLNDDKIVLQPMKWGFSRCDGKGVVINARAESVNEKQFFHNSFNHSRCIIPSRGFFEWKKPSSSSTHDNFDSNSPKNLQLDFNSVFDLSPKADSVSNPSMPLSKAMGTEVSANILLPPSSISAKSGTPALDKEIDISPGKYLIRKNNSPLFLMAGIYQQSEGAGEFTILTMPANSQISPIHDRMPVYLEKTQLLGWLLDPTILNLLLENHLSDESFLISQINTSSGRI